MNINQSQLFRPSYFGDCGLLHLQSQGAYHHLLHLRSQGPSDGPHFTHRQTGFRILRNGDLHKIWGINSQQFQLNSSFYMFLHSTLSSFFGT